MATIADCGSCPPYVNKYVWNNKTLYGFTCGGAACNCTIVFYDENGQKVIITANDRQDVEFVKPIWICKD